MIHHINTTSFLKYHNENKSQHMYIPDHPILYMPGLTMISKYHIQIHIIYFYFFAKYIPHRVKVACRKTQNFLWPNVFLHDL